MPDPDLRPLLARRGEQLQPLVDALNAAVLGPAITRYNSEFGRRYLGRAPSDPIPTAPRLLTTFRTRVGVLIEYGLGVTMDAILDADYRDDLRLSLEVINQYPDYHLRDRSAASLVRIDSKVLHTESDEFSARFDLPTGALLQTDLLMYVAWEWRTVSPPGGQIVYPHILEGLMVPAVDLAQERDERTLLVGGYFDADGIPRAAPRRSGIPPERWEVDTNFGKINRMIHTTRRDSPELGPNVRAFLEFTRRHAPVAPGPDVVLPPPPLPPDSM